MSFYQRLRILLDHLGWTNKKLSEQTGITGKTLSEWKVKPPDFMPRRSNINKIVKATNCSPFWLLSGDGEMFCYDQFSATNEPEKQLIRQYRTLARLDDDILREIQTWINDIEKTIPGFRGWFRIEFQNRFPEFDEWKAMTIKKREGGLDGNRVANG